MNNNDLPFSSSGFINPSDPDKILHSPLPFEPIANVTTGEYIQSKYRDPDIDGDVEPPIFYVGNIIKDAEGSKKQVHLLSLYNKTWHIFEANLRICAIRPKVSDRKKQKCFRL